jgi:hypothetical protein
MLLKKMIVVSTLSWITTQAFCALPPLPQSIKEIDAILSHDFLKTEEMTPEAIWQIQKTEHGYVLETTHFFIPVDIRYQPQHMPGPVPFEVNYDLSKIIAKE